MIEPLTPQRNAQKKNIQGFGTPTPAPTPPALCGYCACSYFFGDTAQNQFAVQLNNGG